MRWSGTRGILGCCAAVVLLSLVVHLPGLVRGLYDPDEAAIAAVAITVDEGGELYVDAIDRKPPIPALVYATSFRLTASTDLRPLRLLVAVGAGLAAAAVAIDLRRRAGERAAWWAAALFVLGAVAFFPVDAQAANFAQFALVPGTLAVLASRWRRRWAAAVTGLALGLAILCRQSWLVGVLPAVVGVVAASAPGWRRRSEALVSFALVLVATIASVALVAPFDRFWHWNFGANSSFLASGAPLAATVGRTVGALVMFVGLHPTLFAGVVGAARTRLGDVRAWWNDPHGADLALWLWVATGGLAVVAGFRFFGHYWLQALPPLVLLAAPVVAEASERMRRLAVAGVAVPAVVLFVAAWTPATFRDLPDPSPVARAIEARTEPGDRVWIWGNFPEALHGANRPIGGALVHSDFVTGRSGGRPEGPDTVADATPGALDAMLDSLRAHPPALVLDTSGAGLRGYDNYPIDDFPELAAFLEAGYERTGTVEGIDIWAPR